MPRASRARRALRRAGLACEIRASYIRTRALLRRSGLHAAVERQRSALRPPKRTTVPDEPGQALALCRSVLRALPIRPDDERCLIRSLVLSGLLSKRGIPSSIVIAVRSEPFKAHAWVEYDGRPLLPPAPPPFQRLLEV